ncbi:MAG: FAD-dependent oxidoreductase, partial [Lentisphaerae bacterium]
MSGRSLNWYPEIVNDPEEYDVVVAGAGPGGLGAAIGAGRAGFRTLLLERAGIPGGTATLANCCHFMGSAVHGRQVVGGIVDELMRRLNERGAAYLIKQPDCVPDYRSLAGRALTSSLAIEPHHFVVEANRMLQEAGVHVRYYAPVVGGETAADGRITSVIHDSPRGLRRVRGKVFIDATGDAHLSYRVGAECVEAPPAEAMTKTLLIDFMNVEDFYRPRCAERFDALYEEGKVPFYGQNYFMGIGLIPKGNVHINVTLTAGDALDVEELTAMELKLREQVVQAEQWYREFMPGFARASLSRAAMFMGIRAGRRVCGEATLSMEMVQQGGDREEPMTWGKASYGSHGIDRFVPQWHYRSADVCGIGRRMLIARGIPNLAMVGRCISVDHRCLDAVRLMATCMNMGEACAVLCACALRRHRERLLDVAYAEIESELRSAG